ncbi:MAG TPA: GGDEF domain-containing protein [Campylobacterales bacterium]|nr:GGDEF domain-containing protein [Campylobacterales bacterium]
MINLDKKWQKVVKNLNFLFTPIVNPHSGELFGVEATACDIGACGYDGIEHLLDDAFRDGSLYDVDLEMRKKVLTKFFELQDSLTKSNPSKTSVALKLFYTLDARAIEMLDYKPGNTLQLIKGRLVSPTNIYFSISERHRFSTYINAKNALNIYKLQGFKIALADFGSGRSGFELLYHSEPNAVKIDKSLIRNIKQNSKNRLFCTEIIKLAHIGGAIVIADGIETKEEFFTLKELGCDLVKGSFIQEASDVKNIKQSVVYIKKLADDDKRAMDSDVSYILNQMQTLPPVQNLDPIKDIIEKFQKDEKATIFPVVDSGMQPIGVVTEKSLKKYIYSQYGLQLIRNQNAGKHAVHCPIADINTPLEDILDMFAHHDELEGVIITKEFKYRGFLSAKSLINALNEKNLKVARDQNPLTKLPGNTTINDFIQKATSDTISEYLLAYLDLDNFKPFNDKFGFRQGDRAILLFADTIKQETLRFKPFLGHIGGDDFFVGFETKNAELGEFEETLKEAIKKFKQNAESFYSADDKKAGYIESKDRFGIVRKFDLLSASCATVTLEKNRKWATIEDIMSTIAELKKAAKASQDKYASSR